MWLSWLEGYQRSRLRVKRRVSFGEFTGFFFHYLLPSLLLGQALLRRIPSRCVVAQGRRNDDRKMSDKNI